MVEEVLSPDAEECYNIEFDVGRSRRYHAFMREYYQRCHDWTRALSVISGSAAFVAVLPEPINVPLIRVLAAIVSISSILNLVFGFSKKADLHNELCKDFTNLAAQMIEKPRTRSLISEVCAERVRIEAREPTVRRLVDIWAYNEEAASRGVDPRRLFKLSRIQKGPIAYLISFGLDDLTAARAKAIAELDAESKNSGSDSAPAVSA